MTWLGATAALVALVVSTFVAAQNLASALPALEPIPSRFSDRTTHTIHDTAPQQPSRDTVLRRMGAFATSKTQTHARPGIVAGVRG